MNEIEKVKSEIKVLEAKLLFLEELEKTKTPVEECYKDWWGKYPETGTWDSFDDTRWQGFQAGYEFAYAISTAKEVMEKVQEEQKEENEWKNVALKFGKKLPVILPYNYDELSPNAWYRWVVFIYDKYMEERDKECGYTAKSQDDVNTLQEKDWKIKVETDYRTGKARHKTRIVDKDGNDYKPEPITTEELLKSNWNPTPQTPEQVADGLKEAFKKAQQTKNWKEIQRLIDEEDNDKNFKNSLDLIKEWGEKNKPSTLYEILWKWWEDIFTSSSDLDANASIDELVNRIDEQFIPPSHDTNDYQWNKCLKVMRDKLR